MDAGWRESDVASIGRILYSGSMIRFRLFFLAAAAVGLSLASALAGIDGEYRVTGNNPGEAGTYDGTAKIEKTGDTYRVTWSVGKPYSGTGILTGDRFSVAFLDEQDRLFGIIVFTVSPDGTLKGKWCVHGQQALGTETLSPK